MKIQVVGFWALKPCSGDASVSLWRWRQHGSPKHWYPTTLQPRRTQRKSFQISIHDTVFHTS